MATPGKVSKKERKKQIPAKTSLNSPYRLQWSPLQSDDVHFILDTLKSKLSATGLEKKEVKGFRQWGKKRNKNPPTGHDSVAEEQGWTDVAARRQLAIGINEVTKALERNQLRLVLVCKSVKPPHMTSHLIALCRTRGVAACQVPRLSESVAGLLGLKCVLALGFRQGDRNEDGTFSDTVEAIVPRVPALQVAWIPSPPSETGATVEGQVGEEEGTAAGQMEVEKGEETRDITECPSCVLQPLKVKKIIPNPYKIRKPKTKKKNTKSK
uniref:Ribonuclease P/MRP 38 subunit n=1 Tax=Oncorhynchus kisutch TaxID=8019 RepID=A0A8C7F566_ONCKI